MSSPIPPYVPVAGMQVPTPLVPRIVAAMRGTYPAVTEGLDDEAAVRAVLRFWTKSLVADYEAAQAQAPLEGALADLRATYRAKAEAARQQAQAAADLITDAPSAEEPATPA